MKMKRLLAWLLVLVMCFALAACKPAVKNEDTKPTETVATTPTTTPAEQSKNDGPSPLLYRVTDKSGHTIWLFGSIHVGRESYYPLPEYVQNAFDRADSLAVEMDIVAFEKDVNAQISALTALVYRDGSKISDHIPKDVYDQCVAILTEYNTYMPLLDMYGPAFWSSTIDGLLVEELGADADLGIDKHLLDMAYKTDKEILEVESAEFQYQMLAGFDDEVQIAVLESSIANYHEKEAAREDLEKMMDIWASGDEKAFADYLAADDTGMTEEEKELYAKYNKAMVTDRNLSMTQFAEAALSSGKEVFICVGAAHVVGQGAMADLLAQRGYTVECITK